MPADQRQAFRLRPRTYWTAAFRSFCPRTVVSPHPSLFPRPVKTTVAISTVKLSYTPNIQCQVESTLTFALILRAFCGNLVDKLWKELWMKMWKIGQGS